MQQEIQEHVVLQSQANTKIEKENVQNAKDVQLPDVKNVILVTYVLLEYIILQVDIISAVLAINQTIMNKIVKFTILGALD